MNRAARLALVLASVSLPACSPHPSDKVAAEEIAERTQVKPLLPTIPNRTFRLTDFGGVGDGTTLNTAAFVKAIAEIQKAGGGHLIVPRGTFRTLPFTLCSGLDLHLEEGSVIAAPDTFAAYGLPNPETLKSQDDVTARVRLPAPLISGKDLHDVAITGTGTIDGNGSIWWPWSERAARAKRIAEQPAEQVTLTGRLIYPRPKMVVINGCSRLHVDGVTFRNSPMFHFVPTHVSDLLIERAKFEAPANAPNTDAIDPGNCTNMLIRDCDINVGDDDVAIKGGGKHLLIEDCRIRHGHGISIGSGTADGVSDMLVRRCTFDGADNGIRIKSMRGAGGRVDNIRYSDITMKNVGNAIVLDLQYVDNNRPNFKGDPRKVPSIQNVVIENVTVESAKNAGKLVGLWDSPFKNTLIRNVHILASNDFIMKDAGGIVMENVTTKIQKGLGPAPSTPIE